MENLVKLRTLGKSDLKVSALGLGCWQFSQAKGFVGKFWPTLPFDEVVEIVKISISGGINWFDTAEVYGWGESERELSKALHELKQHPGDLYIATKWWPLFRTSKTIHESVEKSLRALDGFPIDLYQIHNPFSFSSVKSISKEMSTLVKNKRIRYVGVSNYSAEQMRKIQKILSDYGITLISNQVEYNLLNRKIERNGVLDTAKELGISIIAYSPLAQGLLSGKFHDKPDLINDKPGYRKRKSQFKKSGLAKSQPLINVVKEIAIQYKSTPSQIALNWLIHYHGDIVVAIPGSTILSQANENVGALHFKLKTEAMDRLSDVSGGL